MNWRSPFSSQQIPLACCLVSAALALLFAVSFFYKATGIYVSERKLSSIEKDIPKLATLSLSKQQAETAAKKANRQNLEKDLASLSLLNIERGSLELLARKRPLSESEARRLYFIQKENVLCFKPYRKIENGLCKEIEEKLIHTVEIDADDLQLLLEKIEGKQNTTEQSSLRIHRLTLEKVEQAPHYTLHLELWRKEAP